MGNIRQRSGGSNMQKEQSDKGLHCCLLCLSSAHSWPDLMLYFQFYGTCTHFLRDHKHLLEPSHEKTNLLHM